MTRNAARRTDERSSRGDFAGTMELNIGRGRSAQETRMPVRAHEASEYLRTPEDVAAYLNAGVEESDGDPRLLIKAFRNVAAAQGRVSAIARRADVDRVALSRGLSGSRNPDCGR